MRNWGSVLIVENVKVAIIRRVRDGIIYYVFPGDGIEKGETPEEAAKREAFEELGVEVVVNECIVKIEYNGTQYFFLSEIINGTFGTGQGEEYTDKERNKRIYLPMRIDIKRLSSLDVKPREIVLKVQNLLNNEIFS